MTHRQVKITLKTAKVDKRIVPILKWFNSFPDVVTLHSCQGEPEGQQPYVMFVCQDDTQLHFLVSRLCHYGSITVSMWGNAFRYTFTLADQELLTRDLHGWLPDNPFIQTDC